MEPRVPAALTCAALLAAPVALRATPTPLVDEILVTATRLPVALPETTSRVSVVTRQEIEGAGWRSMGDLLRHLPSVDVVRTGGPGGVTSVFLRGAKSEHTLVLLDGVEINDPISPGRSADIAQLGLEDVERVEVLLGSQSMAYGSDAIGGVISITTRGAAEGETSTTLRVRGGSFGTWRTGAVTRTRVGKLGLSLDLDRMQSGGISAADEAAGNPEPDGYRRDRFALRLSGEAAPGVEVGLTTRHIDAETELDDGGGANRDDVDRVLDTAQTFLGSFVRWRAGRWTHRVGYSYSRTTRHDVDGPEATPANTLSDSAFQGERSAVDLRSSREFAGGVNLLVGTEVEKETASSRFNGVFGGFPFNSFFPEQDARNRAAYLQLHFRTGPVDWQAGWRYDDPSRARHADTHRVGFRAPFVAGFELRGSHSSGFKAPSLFQLFGTGGAGNLALRPESSQGWELGVTRDFRGGRWRLEVDAFETDFTNLIDFHPTQNRFFNLARAEAQGAEASLRYRPGPGWDMGIRWSLTDTQDVSTGRPLLRRPEDKLSLWLARSRRGRSFRLDVRHVGDRQDLLAFPATTTNLSAYTVADVAVGWDLSDTTSLQLRVENLTGEDYQEVLGFGTPGTGFFVSVTKEL